MSMTNPARRRSGQLARRGEVPHALRHWDAIRDDKDATVKDTASCAGMLAKALRETLAERDALDCLNKSTVAAAQVAIKERDAAMAVLRDWVKARQANGEGWAYDAQEECLARARALLKGTT